MLVNLITLCEPQQYYPFAETYTNCLFLFLLLQQCRHPLDLFSVFHENDAVGSEPSERLLPGMHFIPRSCEYCGAEDTDRCTSKCQRPKSFFLKKRPPLCPEDATLWDPETSVSIDLAESKSHPQAIGAQPTSVLMDFFR
jgi:hypothetical protein